MSFNGPRLTKSDRSNSDVPKPNPVPKSSEPISITPPSMLPHFENMRAHSAPVKAFESSSFVVGSPFGYEKRKIQRDITRQFQAKAEGQAAIVDLVPEESVSLSAEESEKNDDELDMQEEALEANKKLEQDDESNSSDELCGVFHIKLK